MKGGSDGEGGNGGYRIKFAVKSLCVNEGTSPMFEMELGGTVNKVEARNR